MKRKTSSVGMGLAVIITTIIAILCGFGIYLGHRLMTNFFESIVLSTGLEGEFLPTIVVLAVVIMIMLILVGTMIFILHKKFNILKPFKRIYGM